MKNSDKVLMEALHSALIGSLLQRIQEGTATAADLGVARQFLKDNGVDISAKHSEPLQRLCTALPFELQTDDPDDDL
jgi:hypothetical protein